MEAGKPFRPSIHYLSIEGKCSESTVKRCMKNLKVSGLITVVEKGNGITGLANSYKVNDYRNITGFFTRPSTSEIYAAEREEREEAAEQEQEETTAQICAEPDTGKPVTPQDAQEAVCEPLSPSPVQVQQNVEKAAQNAIQAHTETLSKTDQARFYLKGFRVPVTEQTIEGVVNAREAGKLSDEHFYKYLELGKVA